MLCWFLSNFHWIYNRTMELLCFESTIYCFVKSYAKKAVEVESENYTQVYPTFIWKTNLWLQHAKPNKVFASRCTIITEWRTLRWWTWLVALRPHFFTLTWLFSLANWDSCITTLTPLDGIEGKGRGRSRPDMDTPPSKLVFWGSKLWIAIRLDDCYQN